MTGYVVRNAKGQYLGARAWEDVPLSDAMLLDYRPTDESWTVYPSHFAKAIKAGGKVSLKGPWKVFGGDCDS